MHPTPSSKNTVLHSKFPLLRRLSIVSLIAMLITAAVLVFAYRHDQLTEHELIDAEKNDTILLHFKHSIGKQINAYVLSQQGAQPQDLQATQKLKALFVFALQQINEHGILKLKIYNQSGITIYSPLRDEIGKISQHPDILTKALNGKVVHAVGFLDRFSGNADEKQAIHIFTTYMPLTHMGKQIGVIESNRDATQLFTGLKNKTIWISFIVLGAFSALYATLFFAVFKTDRAVTKLQKITSLNEERWKFALEGAGDGMWDWDPQTDTVILSKHGEIMLGYDEHEFQNINPKWTEQLHPGDRDRVLSLINEYFSGNLTNYKVEFRIKCKDGSWKWLLSRGKLISRDSEGQPLRMIGTYTDIAERKINEENLRIAAAAFDTHEAILITDADANIIKINRAFTEITGYSVEDVLGQNPRLFQSGYHDKNFYEAMRSDLLNLGQWNGEIWDRHKNGNIYPKEVTITAVMNDLGEVTQYVTIMSDITERKQAENTIHNLAFYDALTNLPNRRLLQDRFNLAVSASARSKQYGAFLFMDMDNFKSLNDTLGHDFGDMMLIEVARRIQLCLRDIDTVARFGGDEFVVLIENLGPDEVYASQHIALIAEKIRSVLATPYHLIEHTHYSSPSIGVSLFYGHNDTTDEVTKRADMAMYQAKESGRNRVQFFDPLMQKSVESRAALESDLRLAISGHQLRLHYQIQVDHNLNPVGAEALVRWIHPTRGTLAPVQFIPVAEESTLILDIGLWVLNTACQQLTDWHNTLNMNHLTISVNISTRQFRQPDFVEQVVAILKKYNFDPSRLKLELTESVVLDDLDFVAAKMFSLKYVLGITLSLDDFGTGYSSLSYLKLLPFDQVKIDQSFVRDIATDSKDAGMVKTIIDMAENFGFNVIAEGVETDAQSDYLKGNGCMSYQGYLFSKPIPVEEFESLLKQF